MKKTRFPRQTGGKGLDIPEGALSGRGKYYEYPRVCPEPSESLELVGTVAVGIYRLVFDCPELLLAARCDRDIHHSAREKQATKGVRSNKKAGINLLLDERSTKISVNS